jgi:hypothetical protein
MEFLKENISWIKDIFTLIFLGTGTIIAILTYRRAIATILQPIRTEVIKKQSELLSELLQHLKDNDQSFEIGLDYVNLVQFNVLLTLRDYGFIFKESKKLFEQVDSELVGWIPCGNSNLLHDVEVIRVFTEKNEITEKDNIGFKKFNDLKKKKIDIDKIYLSKKYSEFIKLIAEFQDNPFLPTSIQMTLKELLDDINKNLIICLKKR